MRINTEEQYLPVYEALASAVRLRILNLLAEKPLNIKELAEASGLSSAIMTMHVRKLETANLIITQRKRVNGSVQKICSLSSDRTIEIELPEGRKERRSHQYVLPIGHFTDFDVTPTCGLATEKKVIGNFDDVRSFLLAERVNAKILWFSQGFVHYKIPNFLLATQKPKELEISMEISSEAPGINEDWPSDIGFWLNGVYLGYWTSPGDFGKQRGKLTPSWWNDKINQYGVMKVIRINESGTFIDGNQISEKKLSELDIHKNMWDFKIEVDKESEHVGGVTLFGDQFGNYAQDILFKLYFE
ncbi:ArsR/SmtB family transcription factor [Scatolibacter rhodanostii]|uniref:ArsR/SmtB family transcription factor n=1 Tax=Scatolibacter rhodanostii TaxID=2014781 RepID=UPI000C06ACDA|nr:ArsR family transcriptional regulator [Scatolibacter rhodanostii]